MSQARNDFAHDGPQLCTGVVTHLRLRPVEHRFVYPVVYCLLPLHALADCRRAFFGINRWRLLSFLERDHGPGDGSPLLPWFGAVYRQKIGRDATSAADLGDNSASPFAEVWLQTFPRVLGYVFNPVSFWYGYRQDGELIAVLAEVCNTFGERHNYLLAHADGRPIRDGEAFERDKVFHVSPFFPVRGRYRFRFNLTAGRPRVRIDYADAGGDLLRTAVSGVPAPLTGRRALVTFLRYPLLTFAVIARIHWQAAVLYFARRVPLFKKPAPPIEETTA